MYLHFPLLLIKFPSSNTAGGLYRYSYSLERCIILPVYYALILQAETVPSKKISSILDLISRKGFETYKVFKQILKETDHIDALERLKEEEVTILKKQGIFSL